MGSRTKRERLAAGLIWRDGHLVKADEYEPKPDKGPLYFSCYKCNHSIPEYMVAEHLKECQNGKAECSKCHKFIKADDFVEHYKNCEGRVKHADSGS